MAKLRFFFAVIVCAVIVCLAVTTAVNADTADELLHLSREIRKGFVVELTDCLPTRTMLMKTTEMELTNRLLENPVEREQTNRILPLLEHELLERLLSRVAFEVQHEGRLDLSPFLLALQAAKSEVCPDPPEREQKAANNIRDLELHHGEWKTSADGRKFWVSLDFPDVVLTATEYRRRAAAAAAAIATTSSAIATAPAAFPAP